MQSTRIAEATDDRPDTGNDALRAKLHRMWDTVAPGWAAHADYIDRRAAELTRGLLDLGAPRPGDRVLELACGPGGLGLAAAPRVAPDGEVVLSDVAPQMTAIAAARATALGIDNVSARVLDLEQIAEPDGSYDVVLCREGLMFATDPARAAREIRRVLRPGGRAALAVWGPRDRNPWLGLVFDAVSAQLDAPVPPPGIPGPFSLADADRLGTILSGAGFADVTVRELPVALRAGSFEEWWSRTSTLSGPLAKTLASLPEPAVGKIRARLREAVRQYETTVGLELPGVSLMVGGRIP
jgi:ubiquinone/menaquinone biosynthesis C-methylase UbiE